MNEWNSMEPTRIKMFIEGTGVQRLPIGVDDQMVAEKLDSVEHNIKTLNTGKGHFSKIRSEDRSSSELAFK